MRLPNVYMYTTDGLTHERKGYGKRRAMTYNCLVSSAN